MLAGFVTAIAGMMASVLGQVVGYMAWLITSFEIGIIKLLAKPDWAVAAIELPWYGAVAMFGLIVWFTKKLRSRTTSKNN